MTNSHEAEQELTRLRIRTAELEREIAGLREALAGQSRLLDLLTMCANCKRILDVDGEWVALEAFLASRLDLEFSHSLCPTCAPGFGFPKP